MAKAVSSRFEIFSSTLPNFVLFCSSIINSPVLKVSIMIRPISCFESLINLLGNTTVTRDKERLKYYLRQCLVALIPIISTVATGMTMGYSAVLLPQLRPMNTASRSNESLPFSPSNDLTITNTDQESWIAASAILAMAPGCWISTLMMDKFGRKITFMLINPIFILGWTILALSTHQISVIVGRLLCGFSAGLLSATSPVYIAETSHPRLRGLLLAGLSLAVAVGIFISHILGTWLHWRLTAHLCSATSIFAFLLGLFIPESPSWLLQHLNQESALEVWNFLTGENSTEEFEKMKSNVNSVKNETTLNFRQMYLKRLFIMPLMIICIFAFTSQFSGVNVVTFYCVNMLTEVSGPENAYLATLILDAVRLIFSIVACWMTATYPRRLLTGVSGFGTALTLFALSSCLLADYGKPWLPIVLLFIYTCTVTVGLVPLPWLLCGELFTDTTTRGLGSGLSAGFAFFCFFTVVKTGPIVLEILEPEGTFAIYGIIVLVGTVFLRFCLPETKDKTLEEIENVFARNSTASKKKIVNEITRF